MSIDQNTVASSVAEQPSVAEQSIELGAPPGTTSQVHVLYATAFILLHLLCLLAFVPWLFSWWGVATVLIGDVVFGMFGINLAYHRLLTHQGLTLPKWLERTFVVCGVCCLQDGPARWVGIHRMHHQHSDHEEDPHTPWYTFFWGHLGWLLQKNKYYGTASFYDRYARDVFQDPFYRWLERKSMFFWVYVIHAIVIFLVAFGIGSLTLGGWAAGLQFGLSILLWGVVIRTVYVWHTTWAINSVTHIWGYRNYETRDHSKNNPVLAVTNFGEGWHNNHHAYPRCAAHGHRWWEFDVTYLFIRILERLGLAKNVEHPKRELLKGDS